MSPILCYHPPAGLPAPPGPPGIIPGPCPTPETCPDIAYLSIEDVFRRWIQVPGIRYNSVTITNDYVVTVVDYEIRVDASAGPVNVYFPQALGTRQFFYVKRIDDSGNDVFVFPMTGDLIDGQPFFPLMIQNSDLAVIDGALTKWDRIGVSIADIFAGGPPYDFSDFARKSLFNFFTSLNSFPSIQLVPKTITEDYELTFLDFGISASASTDPIAIQLPPATGSGQLYYIEKYDDTDEVITINRNPATTDLIGGDRAVSVNFVDQGANAMLYDLAPGYWANIGMAVAGGGGGGGGTIDSTTNLLEGDGTGNAVDSGIAASDVVVKQTGFPTPTNSLEIVSCLQAAGLCAP